MENQLPFGNKDILPVYANSQRSNFQPVHSPHLFTTASLQNRPPQTDPQMGGPELL